MTRGIKKSLILFKR